MKWTVCKSCKWWVPLTQDEAPILGECHKRSPKCTQADGPLDFYGHWPETEYNQFCGDWEKNNAK